MKKLLYVLVGIFLLLVLVGVYLNQKSRFNFLSINSQMIGTKTAENETSSTTTERAHALSKSIDPYRIQEASPPLKDTWIWDNMSAVGTGTDQENIYQARIVRVINPLTEYEIELVPSGTHKILNIASATQVYMPEYKYDDGGTIVGVTFDVIRQREILTTLDIGSLLLVYVSDKNNQNKDETLDSVSAQWISFAD